MKKILILAISLLTGGLTLPAAAAPCGLYVGHTYTYLSGHTSCGQPIYTKRVVIGFDCHHQPIFRYYRIQAPTIHGSHGHYSPPRSYHHSRKTYVVPHHYSGRSSYNPHGCSSSRGGFAITRH